MPKTGVFWHEINLFLKGVFEMAEVNGVQVRMLELDQNKNVTDTSLCKIILHNITRFETRTYFEGDGSRYGAAVYLADGLLIFVDDDSRQLIEKWCDGKL